MSYLFGKRWAIVGVLFGAWLVMGCAKPPTQEISDTQGAVSAAVQSGAEEYAADELKAAQDALGTANAKVEEKDYAAAKQAALDAKSKAEAATAAVETNKAAAKTQAEAELAKLKDDVKSLNGKIAKVKGKAATALKGVKADAASLDARVADVEKDLSGEKFKSALGKIGDIRKKVDELNTGVDSVAKSTAAKGRKRR
jgi:hypothetical protein